MKVNDINILINNRRCFLDKDNNNRDIFIYHLTNVATINDTYPSVLLYFNNDIFQPINELVMSLCKLDKKMYTTNYILPCITSVEINPVFFFVYNTDNYFHFLYDTIPYLITFFHIRKTVTDLKLLMAYPNQQTRKIYTFVTDLLNLLNITQNDIIIINNNTKYENIYISTSYTHDYYSTLPPRSEIYEVYKNLANICNKAHETKNFPKKIYISRRSWIHNNLSNIGTNYTLRRKLINEDLVVKELEEQGFIEIFTENMSMVDKILVFNNADIIVGAIGGGLANAIFCTKKTKLIAIISPTFLDINDRVKYCFSSVDIYYFNDTHHVETTSFKKYMRICCKHKNIVGEIEKIYDDSLLVLYTDIEVVGWNAQNNYRQIILNKNEVECLDDGLNSLWSCDINSLLILVKNLDC